MLCPVCGEDCSKVVKTLKIEDKNKIDRLRNCEKCGYVWSTEEKIKDIYLKNGKK